jgi:alpha-glucosidase (family GH31 glycosyl hydrolase)
MAEGNYNFTSLQPRDEEPLQEIHYVEDDEEEEKTAEQEPLQDIQDVEDDAHADVEEERTTEQEPLQEIERCGQKRTAAARKKQRMKDRGQGRPQGLKSRGGDF